MKALFSLAAVLLVGCASSSANDDATPASATQDIAAASDDLIACKKVKDGSGKIHVTQLPDASREQSTRWHTKLFALAFSGTLDGERIGYSQGDQPDVSKYEKHGDVHELSFFPKTCAGGCENLMITTFGGGEDEETTFIILDKLTIDDHAKTLKIEGKTKGFASPDQPWAKEFSECDVNKDVLGSVKDSL